jgi:hypothetical protein
VVYILYVHDGLLNRMQILYVTINAMTKNIRQQLPNKRMFRKEKCDIEN